MIGRTLGHYRIEANLGAGDMGGVYSARDTGLGRTVAIKVLGEGSLADEKARARLLRETQIADALAHAHEPGVVHCDLKSANVIITPEGRAKVLDFGLAMRRAEADLAEVTKSQASLSEEGTIAGTLRRMAPEVLRRLTTRWSRRRPATKKRRRSARGR